MKELSINTKKRLLWLLAEAKKAGGKTVFEPKAATPGFDAVLFEENALGIEMLIKPEGEHYLKSDWAFRVIIMKDVLAEELPVYATMWRDTENGLNHLVQWIGEGEEQTPDLMAPAEFYDSAVRLINYHVSRLWVFHNLPALKDVPAIETN